MRSIETEGVALHALRAAGCERFEIVEQRHEARQARDDAVDGLVSDEVAVRSIAVFEGQVEELSCAVVRQQVHALLDDGDVGEEVAAGVCVVLQVVDGARIAEGADEPVDVVAR